MPGVDLHVHSTISDGTLPPREVVALARSAGLEAIALTDHDTVEGLPEAMEAGGEFGLEVVPGCELGVEYRGGSMHILGLWIPPDGGRVAAGLADLLERRSRRNERMVEKLNRAGVPILLDDVKRVAGPGAVGRPHFGMVLMEMGFAVSVDEAFAKYIGPKGVGYVPKEKLTPKQALELLKSEEATTILAHPFSLGLEAEGLRGWLRELISWGLDGIEAIYSEHTPEQTAMYLDLAREPGLLVSGGSDFHGGVKPHIHLGRGKGDLYVPYDLLRKMKEDRRSKGYGLV